jgi:hypothetical protein
MIRCTAIAGCLLAGSAGGGTARAPVSLVAAPSHVNLVGIAQQTIAVMNSGRDPVVIDVAEAGLSLDLRGRPSIVARREGLRTAVSWLGVRPRQLTLPAGTRGMLIVVSKPPRGAQPGDHATLVLLTTRPVQRGTIAIRTRIGVIVVVRAPGPIVRRLELRRLRVRRSRGTRSFELLVGNRGNVAEPLGRNCLALSLRRGGRRLATVRPAPRELLPHTSGIVEFAYSGHLRGPVAARVELSAQAPCGGILRRTFRVRL